MVQIVTVDRSLLIADSGKCSVQRVAVPVYQKTEAAEPKPFDIQVSEDVACSDDNGS